MRVEYSLTGLGWSITSLLMTMYEWAEQHVQSTDERWAA
jgi:DNA-binding HxlR family transcriptional regulator